MVIIFVLPYYLPFLTGFSLGTVWRVVWAGRGKWCQPHTKMQKFRLPWAVPFCYHSFDSPSYFPQDWRLVKIETFSKGTVWFCLSEISLSIGSLCFNQLNQANMWLVRLPTIYVCSQIISVPLRASESAVHKALIMGGTHFTTNWDLWNCLMESVHLGSKEAPWPPKPWSLKLLKELYCKTLTIHKRKTSVRWMTMR